MNATSSRHTSALRFTYRELFSLAIQKPIMAQLEVTRNCNQRCRFCFRACAPDRRFTNKPLTAWKRAIEKLVSIGVRELNFSGGEIFMFPQITALFHHAKIVGIQKISVNTNGLMDLNVFDLNDIDELIFSIHGIGAVHDRVTDIPGSFKRVRTSLKKSLSTNMRIGINTVVDAENIRTLHAIRNYFKDYPIAYHAFNLAIDRKRLPARRNELRTLFPAYLKFLKSVPVDKKKLRHGMQNIFWNDRGAFDSPVPLPHCAAGKYKLVIDYRGGVYPCRYFQTNAYCCGNIFRDDAADIWKHGKGFQFFRNLIVETQAPHACANCIKWGKCRGGCLAWRIFDPNLKQYERDIRCLLGHAYLGS